MDHLGHLILGRKISRETGNFSENFEISKCTTFIRGQYHQSFFFTFSLLGVLNSLNMRNHQFGPFGTFNFGVKNFSENRKISEISEIFSMYHFHKGPVPPNFFFHFFTFGRAKLSKHAESSIWTIWDI